MADPFVAEIRIVPFNFAPRGWAFCDGQILPISQNTALFSLLGTTYGGDGRTTFALPDLRGRAAVSPGASPGSGAAVTLGEQVGVEAVTLTAAQAAHSHVAAAQPTTSRPSGAVPAIGGAYADSRDASGPSVGGGQPHENRAPYLAVTWAIAIQGIFPSQN